MSTINFNDKIFAQEALQAFSASLTPLNVFSHSFDQSAKNIGSAVIVPLVGTMTATTFSYSNNSDVPYEGSGGTITALTVNLDQHVITTIDITDYQHGPGVDFTTFAQQQGRALGKEVIRRLWSTFTVANFGASIVNLSIDQYGARSLAKARLGLKKRDVPSSSLSAIVNEDAFGTMLADESFSNASMYGGSEAIREGKIPRAFGLDVYSSNIMPTNGISLVGVAAHADAIALAMRYLEPQAPAAYDSAQKLVDENGITMGYRRHYNAGKGKMYVNFECLFGFTFGLTLGLGLLTRND